MLRAAASAAMLAALALAATGCAASSAGPSVEALPVLPDVVRAPGDVPPPIVRRTPQHVRVHLVAKEVVASLSKDERFLFWTYALAGKGAAARTAVPAPMIRVMAGDTLSVTLTNDAAN